MKKCPTCGHESNQDQIKCPACGAYYSRIIQLIDEEAENEEKQSMRGRWRRIVDADNKQEELKKEIAAWSASLNKTSRFTLLIVFIFVFALIVAVL